MAARASLAICILFTKVAPAAEPVCPPEPMRPVLGFPHWQVDTFSFQLQGAWNATYLLQVSSNLNDWTTFSTNAALWQPWIHLPVSYPQGYVRAVLEDPIYPLFNFAVRANLIQSDSRGMLLDSYDSSDPRYSTNGHYHPAKVKDGGDLALGYGDEGEHDLGNSTIKGKIFTVPNTAVMLGTNARVGSLEWHLAGSTGVEPGWMSNNLRATFMPEPVTVPFANGLVPSPGVGGGRSYDYVLGNGDYRLNALNGEVLVVGNARLLVSSNISAKQILISSNASLQIFCAGANATFGPISNQTDGSSLQIYGLASNSFISFSLAGTLKALIYAPKADCFIGTGGNDVSDFDGACIVRSLRTARLNIHFDEQLKRFCPP